MSFGELELDFGGREAGMYFLIYLFERSGERRGEEERDCLYGW